MSLNKKINPKIKLKKKTINKSINRKSPIEKYEQIFNIQKQSPSTQLELEINDILESKNISGYRTKTIKSGNLLEIEIYPRYKKGTAPKINEINKTFGTSEAQAKLNEKNTRKRIIRLSEGNFDGKGMWITVGYKGSEEPKDLAQAKKDCVNYLRRLNTIHKKQTGQKLKYIYVTEQGKNGKFHHHIIMDFDDRDIAEQKWGKGKYPQARRLQPNVDFGLSGLASYISKDTGKKNKTSEGKNIKNYGSSTNLYKPWEHATISDTKLTRKKVSEIIKEYVDPKEFFQKLYQGYTFKELETSYSDYVAGNYLYVKMRRY